MKATPNERGFGIVELSISTLVFVGFLYVVFELGKSVRVMERSGEFRMSVHENLQRALKFVTADLRSAGYVTVGGRSYPFVFDGGVVNDPDFAGHAHAGADDHSEAGERDAGPSREIVFVLPEDADENGRPDLYNGAVSWSATETSYRVVTRRGANMLERLHGSSVGLVARHIEKVEFDTAESSGWTVPLGCVRARIFARATRSDGSVYRDEASVTVRLRNAKFD